MGLGRILKASLLAALAVVAKLSGTSAAGNPTGVTNAADDVKWEGGAAPNPADVEVVNPLLRGGRVLQSSDSNHTSDSSGSQSVEGASTSTIAWIGMGVGAGVSLCVAAAAAIWRKVEIDNGVRAVERGISALRRSAAVTATRRGAAAAGQDYLQEAPANAHSAFTPQLGARILGAPASPLSGREHKQVPIIIRPIRAAPQQHRIRPFAETDAAPLPSITRHTLVRQLAAGARRGDEEKPHH